MVIIILSTVCAAIIAAGIIMQVRHSKKRKSISFKEAMDLVDLPVVTFYNHGKKLNFILDTGSSNSFMDRKAMSELQEFSKIRKSRIGIMSKTGVEERNIMRIKVPMLYKNYSFEEEFTVDDFSESFTVIKQESGVTLHGILGNTFFVKYKYIIDFGELIAYMK